MKKEYPQEVYLNGEWLQHQNAFISVFDRGFMFGDGIYEVTPFYQGKPFMLEQHLDRLAYCLKEIRMPFDVSGMKELVFEAVERAKLSTEDCAVYIQVTRGTAPRTHHFPNDSKPTFLMYAFPVKLEGFQNKKVDVIISPDIRWQRCDIKSISLMANVMLNSEAIENDFFENVLLRDAYFTEGSHSSVFFVKGQEVFTHPEGPHILSGITRKVVLDLCRELELPIREERVRLDELQEIDEIFLTGTTTQVLTVNSMVSKGKVVFKPAEQGEITKRIQEAFIQKTHNL